MCLSTIEVDQFQEGWEPDDDVMIDHANPQKVITLEHDITTPKVCEYEVVLLVETTLQERYLENLQ
jgi:hypothetical protein